MKLLPFLPVTATLACAALALLISFQSIAAEPEYELSQAVSVDAAGQTVQLAAGQTVAILGSPDASGKVMIRVVLPNGSVSVAQIPVTDIRRKVAVAPSTPPPAASPAAEVASGSGGAPPPPAPASTLPAAPPAASAAVPAPAPAIATAASTAAAAVPAATGTFDSAPRDFGPNVHIFTPAMAPGEIQGKVSQLGDAHANAEFSGDRYAFLFMPGTYKLDIPVGYYAQILGLGQTPDQVTIEGNIHANSFLSQPNNANATCSFWRAVENICYKGKEMSWAVSQGTELRRVHTTGDPGTLMLFVVGNDGKGGWASGGFNADCKIDGELVFGSQQQWFCRNSQARWGSNKSVWNTVCVGSPGAPGAWPPGTSIQYTPLVAEKPYLVADASGGFWVMRPAAKANSAGISWAPAGGGGFSTAPAATAIPIAQFFLARPADTAANINAALAAGKNLILTPGIYHLDDSINITRPDTVVLGLGYPTLIPDKGTPAMKVADVNGVRIGGIIFQAAPETADTHIHSPALLLVGEATSAVSHAADPTVISDIFARVGGATAGWCDSMVTINSNDVIGDNAWLWRADHGTGATWADAKCKNGLVVNGANVIYYGLAVEHTQEYQALWNGNGGRDYFYQSEIPYDVPSQSLWRPGNDAGYSSYKVGDNVSTHEAWGLGVYSLFNVSTCVLANAIEAPQTPGVKFHHILSINFGGKAGGETGIAHVIDGAGKSSIGKTGEFKGPADLGDWPPQQ